MTLRDLLAEWVAARGREVDEGSTSSEVVNATEACKWGKTGT